MTKSYIISIQPQHAVNILNGIKTYEVRKVVLKAILEALDRGETVEMYMYVTKPKRRYTVLHQGFFKDELYRTPKGEIKYGTSVELMAYDDYNQNNFLSGKVVAKLTIDGYDKVVYQQWINQGMFTYTIKDGGNASLILKSGLSIKQLLDYGKGKDLFALHISKVEILDEPKSLSDFIVGINYLGDVIPPTYKKLKKAPQNMGKVWMK